jgi:hypothetical protein
MPFLLPALPAIVGGAATAGAGALGNAIFGGGQKGSGFQAQGATGQDYQNAMSNVNGPGGSIQQQQAFLNALQQQNGIGNQSNVFNQQQGLASILGQQAMGGGPNPALNQLAQTTGQNTANQAALMASQRGIGNNPGLASRNIAQMGAANQQNAVGQAATMRAQQTLAAQQALQQQQMMMANLASQQVGQQQMGINSYGNQALQYQGNLGAMLGGQNAQNAASARQNAGIGAQQAGGLAGGIGAGLQAGMAGALSPKPNPNPNSDLQASIPSAANFGQGISFGGNGIIAGDKFAHGGEIPIQRWMKMKSGGKVPVKLSPGEEVISPSGSTKTVPGKAKVAGDSPKNDTYSTSAEPGSIVVPRSKVKDPEKAKAFVEAILRKKGMS